VFVNNNNTAFTLITSNQSWLPQLVDCLLWRLFAFNTKLIISDYQSCLRSVKQEETKKKKRKRLIIITMVKKTTKGAAKSDETGGLDDPRAGSGYNTEATGGGFYSDVDFGNLGSQGSPTTTAATTAGFSAGAFGGAAGVSGATTVSMRAPSPSFGGQMYGMSGSGPSARSVTTTTTTNNPSGVAVGGVLTGGVATTGCAKAIEHIIGLCRFLQDSTMVEYMDQQQWDKLEHVVVELEDFKDIYTVRSDGVTIKAWPLKTPLRMLKCFLLWFNRHNRSFYCTTSEDDVLLLKNSAFDEYICLEEYAEDNAAAGISAAASLKAPPSIGSSSVNAGTSGTAATGSNVVPGTMTAQEFRGGVKRAIADYTNFKDDEHFSAWNQKFVAAARMQRTHLVLDPKYVPQDDVAKAAFEEM
jgi:hypothetical protein